MSITQRIDSVTHIPAAYKHASLPAPKSVKIELSPRCNYRCGFCAVRTREKQPKHDMSLEFFKRITHQMKLAGVQEIGCFYLGESFMNVDLLVSAVAYLKQIGIPYVFLTSNASLATSSAVERVMQAGLDSLKWSVNSSDEQQFTEVCDVSPKWFRASLRNIKAAWEIREKKGYGTNLYASSIRYDGEQQRRMELLLADSVLPYVDQHYWLPLYSMGSLAVQREQELGYRPIAGNQGRLDSLCPPLPCWALFTEGHVTAEGKLSACCFDSDGRWEMADLTSVSFMEGWNSKRFQELRTAHLRRDVSDTICKDCIAYQ